MTVPNSNKETPTTTHASETLPALPAKRARRRSTRGSHSWRFRKPPSRKRVEVTAARCQPQVILTPELVRLPEVQQ
jgi:hypothetical protein